jgi:hypothetical protein
VPMSVFLVVVETGKAVPPSALPATLIASPVQVRPYGPASRQRAGLAISDGVMRTAGVGAVAHSGELLRNALLAYVRERLELHRRYGDGRTHAPIHLAFTTFTGPIVETVIDINNESVVDLRELRDRITRLELGEVVGVSGPPAGATE